jgi:hypothetical protein
MAPKKQGKRTGSATGRSTDSTRRKVAAKGDGIFKVASPAQEPKKGAKELERKDTEEIVNKAMKDNLNSYTPHETDVLPIGPKDESARQLLTAEIRDKRKTDKKPGAIFYRMIRRKIAEKARVGTGAVTIKPLEVTDESQPVKPVVNDAVADARGNGNNRFAAILSLAANEKVWNQKEYVILLKFIQEIASGMSKAQRNVILAVGVMVYKRDLDRAFAAETDAVREVFDNTLLFRHNSMKHNGDTMEDFWDERREVLKRWMDESDIKAILACGGNWESVDANLKRVSSSCKTGKAMVKFPMGKLREAAMANEIETMCDELNAGPINSQTMEDLKDKIDKKLDIPLYAPLLKECRRITVNLHKVKIIITVRSRYMEIEDRMAARTKSRAVDENALAGLGAETNLIEGYNKAKAAPANQGIDDEFLLPYKNARKFARRKLPSESPSGELLVHMLKKHKDDILEYDTTFDLEISFFEAMTGSEGERILEAKALAILPDSTDPERNNIDAAFDLLSQLLQTPLFEFVQYATQERLRAVLAILKQLRKKMPPSMTMQQTDFLKKMKECMGYFISAGAVGSKVYGQAAIKQLLQEVRAKDANSEPLNFDDVNAFKVYHWLLDDPEGAEVRTWNDDIQKAGPGDDAEMAEEDSKKTQSRIDLEKSTADLGKNE